jgi:hypothetical protein
MQSRSAPGLGTYGALLFHQPDGRSPQVTRQADSWDFIFFGSFSDDDGDALMQQQYQSASDSESERIERGLARYRTLFAMQTDERARRAIANMIADLEARLERVGEPSRLPG